MSQAGIMVGRGSALRKRAEENARCAERLDEAWRLCNSLYNERLPNGELKIIPSLADHGLSHVQRVVENIDGIIFTSHAKQEFGPTPAEAMYLLASAWLHDIGMLHGIFEDEVGQQPTDWKSICDGYEERTEKYLHLSWQKDCWPGSQKGFLSQICQCHRRHRPLASVSEKVWDDQTQTHVRLRELAALLRLADAFHVNESRACVDLKRLFDPVWEAGEATREWQMPKVVSGVNFDHQKGVIEIQCVIPTQREFGAVRVDPRPVLSILEGALQQVVDSVADALWKYSNTRFRAVELIPVEQPEGALPTHAFVLPAWPTLLTTVSSATEVFGMVLIVLDAIVNSKSRLPLQEIRNVLKRAVTLHSYNFLVRQLEFDIEEFFRNASNSFAVEGEVRKQFLKMLEDRLNRRVSAYSAVAHKASGRVGSRDILVVYGYSRTIMHMLTTCLKEHQGFVILVPCVRNDPELRIVGEDQRVREELHRASLRFCEVPLQGLAGFLNGATHPIKFLVGSRGVFGDGEVLCSVGNVAVALVVKSLGGEVLVVADSEKQRVGSGVLSDVRQVVNQERRSAEAVRANLTPGQGEMASTTIDCLIPGMHDAIIGSEED